MWGGGVQRACGPTAKLPFGWGLTLSDRLYTPTLIRADNGRCVRLGGGCRTARLIVTNGAGERTMSDEFDGLDATEKAGLGTELNRCRVLATKLANELGNKRPEHIVGRRSRCLLGRVAPPKLN
jgi:hypothetical protein